MDFTKLPTGPVRLVNLTVPGCLLGQPVSLVPHTMTIAGGRIVDEAPGAAVVDLNGAMAFPAFVDMHTHLDKAHIWPRMPNPDGTFNGALAAVRADKDGRWDDTDLALRMEFSLKCAYAHGTRAIRTHLDYFPPETEVSWEVFGELREAWADRIAMQAAALTGIDLSDTPGAVEDCADLVARHDAALGAVIYPGPELGSQLSTYFTAAETRGLSLDFHVDETTDPNVNTLDTIARIAVERRFPHPIVVGHLCSLSTMPEAEALATLDRVAEAGLHVVSLPMCNLYLQDRQAARTPRNRGITLVHEMKARRIPVSFASDNTRDPFYAYGDMDMVEVMREATRLGHLDHSDPDWTHAFVTNPAAACGFTAPSIAPGAPADLVICSARSWTELFARPQSDRIVLRDGVAINRALPDYAELDHLMTEEARARIA